MTKFDNKFVPQAPKTYTVLELRDQRQEQQQPIKKSPLSAAARSKIIRKNGGYYVSERVEEINPGYGPMPSNGCKQEAGYEIHFSLTGEYSFKQSGATFTSCKISGKVKDIGNV